MHYIAAGLLSFFDPRIVNGENAKSGEIPYQVHILLKHTFGNRY